MIVWILFVKHLWRRNYSYTGCKQEAQNVTVWGLDQFYFFSSSSSLSIYDVSSYRKDGLRIFHAEKTWTQKQLFWNGQSNEISYRISWQHKNLHQFCYYTPGRFTRRDTTHNGEIYMKLFSMHVIPGIIMYIPGRFQVRFDELTPRVIICTRRGIICREIDSPRWKKLSEILTKI